MPKTQVLEFFGEFMGHTEEGTPQVSMEISANQAPGDSSQIILVVGAVHFHMDAADVLLLTRILTAVADTDAIAKALVEEGTAKSTAAVLPMLIEAQKFVRGLLGEAQA